VASSWPAGQRSGPAPVLGFSEQVSIQPEAARDLSLLVEESENACGIQMLGYDH
jgi:hypothetical protein